ncbi:ABC transporter permease [Pseudorhodoferax sp. Leaf265]|uniref:ABC transporter permease n=1 Tax=Pseudorhodoferax sp. Leaf265 TaxID=1736315 RepID=UPI0006F5597A|nr:ABC transporter permease [Pseudorhodoferax sp. Leaf265]KQP17279.1 sugar ABC transporter permease [Pseudorhodoferax sp. Leaf265]
MTASSVVTDPHAAPSTSPSALVCSIHRNRHLVLQLAKREVVGRYKGSFLGMTWSFFNPVLMLAVYTFVFSVAFKARWGAGTEEGKAQFAIVLFVGLMVHGLLSEVLNRAPALVLANANLVKKVVFPLEILPLVSVLAALFHCMVSLGVLLAAILFFTGYLHWSVILAPLVFLPLLVLTTGLAWILASLGVYLRDVSQTVGIVTSAMMFLAPVFYPVTALPQSMQSWLFLNPLTFIIEQARLVLIWGSAPDWLGLGVYMLVAVLVAWAGYAWFQKTRKGFADVL